MKKVEKVILPDGREGEVVHREGSKLYINWLNDKGNLVQSIKDESEVTIKEEEI
jgi:hypothetical protein